MAGTLQISHNSSAESKSGGITSGDYVVNRGALGIKEIAVIGGVAIAVLFAWNYLKKARK